MGDSQTIESPVAFPSKKKRSSRRKMMQQHSSMASTTKYLPILGLVATAFVGICWAVVERRRNSRLQRRLIELENSLANAISTTESVVATPTTTITTAVQEYNEFNAQLATLRLELESEEQERLLGEEDRHLQTLKEELEELRRGIQADLETKTHPHCSGVATPVATTPTHRDTSDERILSSLTLSSSSLSSPFSSSSSSSSASSFSAPAPSVRQHNQSHHRHDDDDTDAMPVDIDIDIDRLCASDDDDSWLSSSPHAYTSPSSPFSSSSAATAIQRAVTPPLPPRHLHLHSISNTTSNAKRAVVSLEAALRAALDDVDEGAWDNEEEWLLKTARTTTVRPLPRVVVPRLNLTDANTNSSGRGTGSSNTSRKNIVGIKESARPLTISARQGIKERPKPPRGCGGGGGGTILTARRRRVGQEEVEEKEKESNVTLFTSSSGSRTARGQNNADSSHKASPTPRLLMSTSLRHRPKETPIPTTLKTVGPTVSPLSSLSLPSSPSVLSTAGSVDSSISTTSVSGTALPRPPTKIPRLQLDKVHAST